MRTILTAAAAMILASGATAQTRSGLWGTHYNMGTFAAGTGDADSPTGGWLSVQCNSEKREGYVYTAIKGAKPATGSTISITVNSRGWSHPHRFRVDGDGSTTINPKGAAYLGLWNDLRRGDTAVVRYPDGRFWVASLAGAGKALTPGGCAD